MYFSKFPEIFYQFDIGSETELKVVKDVTANVRIRTAIMDNISLFDEYDILEGETVEIIASKVYGNPEYHWVIMLCNQRYDNTVDFPMSYHTLEEYIQTQYPGELAAVHHYENDEGFTVTEDYIGRLAVSNYDYEVRRNDQLRRIRLVNPRLLAQILNNFKALI